MRLGEVRGDLDGALSQILCLVEVVLRKVHPRQDVESVGIVGIGIQALLCDSASALEVARVHEIFRGTIQRKSLAGEKREQQSPRGQITKHDFFVDSLAFAPEDTGHPPAEAGGKSEKRSHPAVLFIIAKERCVWVLAWVYLLS